MAVRTDFVAGEVLAAQDLDDTFAAKVDYATPVNTQTGTTYTFVLADGLRLTTASNASASTFTIPPQSSVVWLANSVIRLVNFGAGAVTVNGGSGVTVTNTAKTLAQFESAACIRTGSNAWTVVPFSGGVGNANFSDVATGTYTDGGVDFKFITFNSSGTLTVTGAGGFADILVVGGGAGGARENSAPAGAGGGGAGGHLSASNVFLKSGTLTVTIAAGGTGGLLNFLGTPGGTSRIGDFFSIGGGQGNSFAGNSQNGFLGGSGGGGAGTGTGGAGVAGLGFAGGNGGGTVTPSSGGGGGGSSIVGSNGSSGTGGAGGAGVASSITGSAVTRGGGGGGGGTAGAGAGGTGGGGAGSSPNANAVSGGTNLGGGGGGCTGSGTSGAGGSGVVIIRVRTN